MRSQPSKFNWTTHALIFVRMQEMNCYERCRIEKNANDDNWTLRQTKMNESNY